MSQIISAVAGSLSGAIGVFAARFGAATGHQVDLRAGPAGLLTQAIRDGLAAQVFISASPDGPTALHHEGLFDAPRVIAHNRTVTSPTRSGPITGTPSISVKG